MSGTVLRTEVRVTSVKELTIRRFRSLYSDYIVKSGGSAEEVIRDSEDNRHVFVAKLSDRGFLVFSYLPSNVRPGYVLGLDLIENTLRAVTISFMDRFESRGSFGIGILYGKAFGINFPMP